MEIMLLTSILYLNKLKKKIGENIVMAFD